MLSRSLSLVLAVLLIFSPAGAQTPLQGLQLRVVQSIAEAQAGSAEPRELIVEVADSNGSPVPEAMVSVRLPEDGPSGAFSDGKRSAVASSDSSGRARISGIRWNSTPGPLPIRITASKGASHAGLILEAKVVAAPGHESQMREANAPEAKPMPAVKPALQSTPLSAALAAPSSAAPSSVPPSLPPSASAPHASLTEAPRAQTIQKPTPAETKPAIAQPAVIGAPSLIATAPSLIAAAPSPIAPAPSPHPTEPISPAPREEPHVSITNTGANQGTYLPSHHGGKKKWIILAAVAAGAAGGAVVMMGKSKSGSSSSTNSGVTIGAPTISIGGPQ